MTREARIRDITAARNRLALLRTRAEEILGRHSFYFRCMAWASVVIPTINGAVALSTPVLAKSWVNGLNYASGLLGLGLALASGVWIQIQVSKRAKILFDTAQEATRMLGIADQEIEELELSESDEDFVRRAVAIKSKLISALTDMEVRLRGTLALPDGPAN